MATRTKRLLTKYKIVSFFESKGTVDFGKHAWFRANLVLGLDRRLRGYTLDRHGGGV